MAHDWMIDVLADLRQYAVRNYHFRLAEQLDDAIVTAAVELRAAEVFDADPPEPMDMAHGRDGEAALDRGLVLVD